jgi:hypothetical protein
MQIAFSDAEKLFGIGNEWIHQPGAGLAAEAEAEPTEAKPTNEKNKKATEKKRAVPFLFFPLPGRIALSVLEEAELFR